MPDNDKDTVHKKERSGQKKKKSTTAPDLDVRPTTLKSILW